MITFNPGKYVSAEMKEAIAIYNNHQQNNTVPTAADLKRNAFLSYIYIVHRIDNPTPDESEEFRVNPELAWLRLITRENLFSNAMSYHEKNRCLRSSVYLLRAWIYSNLAKCNNTKPEYATNANKDFAKAKEYEVKKNIFCPISGGRAHHLAAQLAWSADRATLIEDRKVAIREGFDYTAFAFSEPMLNLAVALITHQPNPLLIHVMPASLADLPLSAIVSDECIYQRDIQNDSDNLLEDRSTVLAHYLDAIMLLSGNQIDLAVAELKQIVIAGEHNILCDFGPADDTNTTTLKEFWRGLLLQDYGALVGGLLEALTRYTRSKVEKQARQALRNQIVTVVLEIDSLGATTEDSKKVAMLKSRVLPLIVKLAGTDLSVNQARGMKFASSMFVPKFVAGKAVKGSLSKLAINILEVFYSTVGLQKSEIEQIHANDLGRIHSSGQFNDTLARSICINCIEWLQNESRKQKITKLALFSPCKKAYAKLLGNQIFTPSHSLLFLGELALILSSENSFAELAQRIDAIYQRFCQLGGEQYDPYRALNAIFKKVDSNIGRPLFDILQLTGEFPENTSLFHSTGQGLSLPASNNNTEARKATISYLIALELFSKKYYKIGAYYLAQAFILGEGGNLFAKDDRGFCRGLFADRNWHCFYTILMTSMQGYHNNHRKSRALLFRGRADYANQIITELTAIEAKDKLKDCDKIDLFKEIVLPKLLYLAGFNLGDNQRTAMNKKILTRNLCKATKNALNIATQLLGLTIEDFDIAVNKCIDLGATNPSADQADTLLGIEASKKFFLKLRAEIDAYLTKGQHILVQKCFPYLAHAVGHFSWRSEKPFISAYKLFLGVVIEDESAQNTSAPLSDGRGSRITVAMDEVILNEVAIVGILDQEDSDIDLVHHTDSDDESSEVLKPSIRTRRRVNSSIAHSLQLSHNLGHSTSSSSLPNSQPQELSDVDPDDDVDDRVVQRLAQ